MFKSIFGRMFWTYAILLLLVLSTISLSMSMLFSNFIEQKQIETITSVAHTVEYWTTTLQVEQSDARSLRAYSHFLNSWSKFTSSDITIVNRDGEVFNSTCNITDVPDELLECIEIDEITAKRSNFDGFYEHAVLTVSFPMHYKDNVIGAILFNIGIPELRQTLLEMLFMLLLSSFTAIVFSVAIIYWQAKNISKPIAQINKAAQNIAAGNFSERVHITTNDEIGQLASTFNFMASSIEKSEKNRRRFVSDISHELRTPMTSISGFVGGILDGTIPDEAKNDYLEIVLNESNRLTRLVNDMLEMSKMQSEEFKLHITPFDINALICSCLVNLEKRIEAKSLDVDADFRPEKLITLGDKDQIQRVLINLIDNAIKFSNEGNVIKVHTSIANGKAYIAVTNTGEGINENDLKHIFDRFYKTDESREKDRTGAGLGLSLVHNIIRLHKQTITATSKPDGNGSFVTTFKFTLEIE